MRKGRRENIPTTAVLLWTNFGRLEATTAKQHFVMAETAAAVKTLSRLA